MYKVTENIKQLQVDIKKGCANAYVKTYKKKERVLRVYLGDFENYVRKGFALYITKRSEIEAIIPGNFSYIFSPKQVEKVVEFQDDENQNIYHFLDSQVEKVEKYGLDEREFMQFLTNEVENTFASYHELGQREANKDQLAMIIDRQIVDLVYAFLMSAQTTFGLVYDEALFNGLCLHIDAIKNKRKVIQKLHPSFVEEIQKLHPHAYELSRGFITKINEHVGLELPDSEVIILASLISQHQKIDEQKPSPVILVAMHGEHTATNVVKVISSLSKSNNVYAFDLDLTASYEHELDRLQQLLVSITNSAGILVIYDMGSIVSMCEIIADIEHIDMEFIQVPLTLIGIELARQATEVDTVAALKANFQQEVSPKFIETPKNKKEVIISLCSTGEGGSMKVKEMIDELKLFGDREVITLSYISPTLTTDLAKIEETSAIYCIVSTHNPHYRNVKFIPMTKVLEKYLSQKNNAIAFINPEDLNAIFEYLEEQLTSVNIHKLRTHLPTLIQKIQDAEHIDTDQSIGLLLHIAPYIERLIGDNYEPENYQKETIIQKHTELYNFLKKNLKPIERSFKIIFSDDALANIITIIRKL